MASEQNQEFGPFRRPAGIRHVAGDEHEIERPLGVDGIELGQQPRQPDIPARPGASALDAESVALARQAGAIATFRVRYRIDEQPGSADARGGNLPRLNSYLAQGL